MKLIYSGSLGTLDINNDDILLLQDHTFFDYLFSVESKPNMEGVGERVKRITLPSKNISFSLMIKKEKIALVRNLFERDLRIGKPGRLELNGAYLYCFVNELTQKTYGKYSTKEILSFKLTTTTPLWIIEKAFEFSIYAPNTDTKGFKLPMRFPMRFVNDDTLPIIKNDTDGTALSEITFYGPVVNPVIMIDNYPYGIAGTLLDGERYIINQQDKTVIKITASGDKVNVFHMRQKTPSIFTPISGGNHPIVFSGIFSVRIKLFEGSVSPPWK